MSFLTDLFEGNTGSLGTDLSHTGSSLMNHPDELAETIGGAAALATGGLALGGELPFLGAGAGADAAIGGGVDTGGLFSSMFGDTSAATGALGTSGDQLIAPALDVGSGLPGSASSYASTGVGGGTDPGGLFSSMFGDTSQATGAVGGGAPGGGVPGSGFAGGDPSLGANPSLGGGMIGPQQPPGTGGSFLSNLGTGAVNSITKNPLGIAAAGAGLGFDLLKGNPTDPNQKVLEGQAGQLGAQGQQLMSYLSKGTLPPALKAQLTQAVSAEKARIISGYAARGQPTDPNQNSALAQELNSVDTNAVAAMAQAQIQMMQTGLQETGLSTQLYETLTKLDQQNNQQLMQAISSFAAALGGGGMGGGGQTFKMMAA